MSELENLELPKDAYFKALTQEYVAIAKYESDQFDWSSARIFSQKAKNAANQEEIAPESIYDWRIPKIHRIELEDARIRLAKVLNDQNQQKFPGDLAATLASFDCWMEQAEENLQIDDIQNCREKFYVSLSKLDESYTTETTLSWESEEKAEDAVLNANLPQSFLIFFPDGGVELNQEAMDIIDQVTQLIDFYDGQVAISIIGHSDAPGSEASNMEISQERALAVEDILRAGGTPLPRIDLRSEGEKAPLVVTDENQPEPLNRRVEIILR